MVVLVLMWSVCVCVVCFFFQAEDGIRDLVRSRGLGDVYKRQTRTLSMAISTGLGPAAGPKSIMVMLVSEDRFSILSLIHI